MGECGEGEFDRVGGAELVGRAVYPLPLWELTQLIRLDMVVVVVVVVRGSDCRRGDEMRQWERGIYQ